MDIKKGVPPYSNLFINLKSSIIENTLQIYINIYFTTNYISLSAFL